MDWVVTLIILSPLLFKILMAIGFVAFVWELLTRRA